MIRVWFNHWFSTVCHLIDLMCEGHRGEFTVIGTNKSSLAVYKSHCDEWYLEPENISAEEYIEFCIDFCVKHEVDIFVPRRFLVEVVRNKQRFDTIGVRLFANTDAEMLSILDDKQKAYGYFGGIRDKREQPESCRS